MIWNPLPCGSSQGLTKASMRRHRYGFSATASVTSGKAAAATHAMCFTGAPAR